MISSCHLHATCEGQDQPSRREIVLHDEYPVLLDRSDRSWSHVDVQPCWSRRQRLLDELGLLRSTDLDADGGAYVACGLETLHISRIHAREPGDAPLDGHGVGVTLKYPALERRIRESSSIRGQSIREPLHADRFTLSEIGLAETREVEHRLHRIGERGLRCRGRFEMKRHEFLAHIGGDSSVDGGHRGSVPSRISRTVRSG